MKYVSCLIFLLFFSCEVQEESGVLKDVEEEIIVYKYPVFELTIQDYCVPNSTSHKDYFIVKKNLLPRQEGYLLDFDSDGLSDAVELSPASLTFTLDRSDRDSNNDFYGDVVVYNLGLDNTQQALLPVCTDSTDSDADGLNDCEEAILRLDKNNFDTDSDGIPDGIELRSGLNPAKKDALIDTDADGTSNIDEIRVGAPIDTTTYFTPNSERISQEQAPLYEDVILKEKPSQTEFCYDVEVSNLVFASVIDINLYDFYFIYEEADKRVAKRLQITVPTASIDANARKLIYNYDDATPVGNP